MKIINGVPLQHLQNLQNTITVLLNNCWQSVGLCFYQRGSMCWESWLDPNKGLASKVRKHRMGEKMAVGHYMSLIHYWEHNEGSSLGGQQRIITHAWVFCRKEDPNTQPSYSHHVNRRVSLTHCHRYTWGSDALICYYCPAFVLQSHKPWSSPELTVIRQ